MTNAKQEAFLAAYQVAATIAAAARAAGIDRKTHYYWMDEDPEYAQRFAVVHEETCETLESEARRRAIDGVEEQVIYQGIECKRADGTPLTVRKYSDTMLIFLLKAAKPDKYRDNFKGEVKQLFRSAVDLTQLSDEELKTLDALSKKVQLRAA